MLAIAPEPSADRRAGLQPALGVHFRYTVQENLWCATIVRFKPVTDRRSVQSRSEPLN